MKGVDEYVGGHLHQDIADIENAQTGGILAVIHVQILLEPLETSRTDVVPIEVVHNVDENEDAAASIQLELHSLLNPRASLRVGQRRTHRGGIGPFHRPSRVLEVGDISAGLGGCVCHGWCCSRIVRGKSELPGGGGVFMLFSPSVARLAHGSLGLGH